MQEDYDAMVAHLARILCANTNVAPKDSPLPIYDVPDDLVWLESPQGPVLAARWRLYEERARIALQISGYVEKRAALMSILQELQNARQNDQLPDLALIEKLAVAGLS